MEVFWGCCVIALAIAFGLSGIHGQLGKIINILEELFDIDGDDPNDKPIPEEKPADAVSDVHLEESHQKDVLPFRKTG